MSIAKVYSAQLVGFTTHIITIEVDLSNGLHAFVISGLGNKAVDEAKDRISAAIKNSGYKSPKQKNQKVVISLAPADLRKEGTGYDLGMALGYLVASGDIDFDPECKLFLGELSLEGCVRKISGILPLVRSAQNMGYKEVYVPIDNKDEAALVRGILIFPVQTLADVIHHLTYRSVRKITPQQPTLIKIEESAPDIDFSVIKGQEHAKRGLEIAAAGGHNIAMYGPPGTGKTMLAQAFRGLLPQLDHEEILEVTGIHSIARVLKDSYITQPPFRAPHHTASYSSLVGGGTFPRPGEITLAHHGVLFLDELTEFDKTVIEALRQPLEDGRITISRTRGNLTFPANCILVATMNPCPCGYGKRPIEIKGDGKVCICTDKDITSYKKKLSGPIIDRIDIWVSVTTVEYDKLSGQDQTKSETTQMLLSRISKARKMQLERYAKHHIPCKLNSDMPVTNIETLIPLTPSTRSLITKSAKRLKLSGRAFHRLLKVARTIADLENSEEIKEEHILEALQYRQKF